MQCLWSVCLYVRKIITDDPNPVYLGGFIGQELGNQYTALHDLELHARNDDDNIDQQTAMLGWFCYWLRFVFY